MPTKYTFIDESGRLEFKHADWRYFILAAIVTPNPSNVNRILPLSFLRGKAELKAFRASPNERRYVLGKLNRTDCKVYVKVGWKNRYITISDLENWYYYMASNLLYDIITDGNTEINITFDKKI